MKRIAIFGYYGFGNTGDDAVLFSLLDDLAELNSEMHITVFSNNPQLTKKQYAKYKIDTAAWDDFETLNTIIRQSSLLIIGGGGLYNCYLDYPAELFLKGNHRYFSVVTFGLPYIAWKWETPCIVCAAGASEIWSEEAKRHIGKGLAKCNAVTVRDEGSKRILECLPGAEQVKIVVTGDPVFRLDHYRADLSHMLPLFDEVCCMPRPLVGVSLRNWDFAGDQDKLLREISGAINQFHKNCGEGSFLFLPFDNGSVLETLSEDDLIFERLIKLLYPDICYKKIEGYLQPYQASKLIEMCDLTLCMRLHPVIMSLKNKVPVVGIGYDQKVRNVMEMCGVEDWCVSIETITSREVYLLMVNLYENTDTAYRKLMDAFQEMCKKAKENIGFIQKLIDKK